MPSEPKNFFNKVFALNGWWKSAIAMAPFLILVIGMGVFTHFNSPGKWFVPIVYPLFGLGAVIAGIFTVHATWKRRPKTHILLHILLFLVVASAYWFVTFLGCAYAILLNWPR